MGSRNENSRSVDGVTAYLAGFSGEKARRLRELRALIRKAAPLAKETLSYGMPAFRSDGILVWYAGCANHIGLYPRPAAIKAFERELAAFEQTKGSIHFDIDQPLPAELIQRIVQLRVEQDAEEHAQKMAKKAKMRAKPRKAKMTRTTEKSKKSTP